jgi:5-methylcytosine-specific restriction enzyme subunit McrC
MRGRRMIAVDEDALSYATSINMALRSMLFRLSKTDGYPEEIRRRVIACYRRMEGVPLTQLTEATFADLQLNRHTIRYALALSICRFLVTNTTVDSAGDRFLISDFERDHIKMRKVFEDFARNFYKHHLRGKANVRARRITWAIEDGTAGGIELLPTLNLDAVIERADSTLIVETKYTPRVLSMRFEVERMRTEHLYQAFAYARNFRHKHNPDTLLLYPSVGRSIHEKVRVDGRNVSIAAVDFSKPWFQVEDDLLSILP